MKAIVIHEFGGPDVLRYEDVPEPSIKPDEIRIRVHSAGVSPFDLHVRDGWYKDSYPFPITLGWEISGVVAECGAQVFKFREGDLVFAHPSVYRNGGGYADYAAVKESEAVLKPASITHREAAAASMNALTAWQALFDTAHLSAGQKVLIHAAAGGVGHLAVQLARWKGAYVIGTASAKNKQFLLDLGIDEFIDYHSQPFEKAVKNVDAVFDTIGGETLVKSFSTLKKGGIAVSIVDFERIKEAPKFGVRGENVIVAPNPLQMAEIAKLLEEGTIKPHIETSFPLKEAKKAQIAVQSGHTRGKIVLDL